MEELAGEAFAPRPLGHERVVVESGGDHHCRRIESSLSGLHCPRDVASCDALDLGPEPHVELVMRGVVLQVLDPSVARWMLAVAPAAGPESGLRAHPAGRVEPQRRVTSTPAGGHLVRALENDDVRAGPLQSRTGGEPGSSCPADHGVNHRSKFTLRTAASGAKRAQDAS
jgi:hypothetical protein